MDRWLPNFVMMSQIKGLTTCESKALVSVLSCITSSLSDTFVGFSSLAGEGTCST
jgi:hypothetical protein